MNLGVGIPPLAPLFLAANKEAVLHAESGVLDRPRGASR
jgi:acyl CoA:acetate/3-ketoacid CoA transferase beta subunit